MQYRVPRSLGTWWQRAGRGGRRLSVDATAILLVEPRYFDLEKEKAAIRAAARAAESRLKRSADGQLQPESSKRPRTSATVTARVPPSTVEVPSSSVEKPKIDQAMDDFINAKKRPAYMCRRKVASVHFGNDCNTQLGTFGLILLPSRYSSSHQTFLTAVIAVRHILSLTAATSATRLISFSPNTNFPAKPNTSRDFTWPTRTPEDPQRQHCVHLLSTCVVLLPLTF